MPRPKLDKAARKAVINITVEPALKQFAVDMAKERHQTVSALISELLMELVEEEAKKQRKAEAKAKKEAKKEAKEREQIPGQTEWPTFNPEFENLLYKD